MKSRLFDNPYMLIILKLMFNIFLIDFSHLWESIMKKKYYLKKS